MKIISLILPFGFISSLALCSCSEPASIDYDMTKQERKSINSGNKSFQDSDYVSAIGDYNRALATNQENPIARFNLAAANYAQLKKENLAKATGVEATGRDSLLQGPASVYEKLIKDSIDQELTRKSAYNLGNLFYNNNNFDQSIERYKQALRIDPDDDWARTNLRLAQLKRQNGGGENNDQNQDNQDDKDQQENQDKQNQQDQQNNDKNEQQQPQQPQQHQHQQSPDNMEQILKAMENAESATREKVNEKEQRQQSRRVVDKPW